MKENKMQQQSIERFVYTDEDIEKLIYQDILKQYSIPKGRVKTIFVVVSEPWDGPGFAPQKLKCANVEVDITK